MSKQSEEKKIDKVEGSSNEKPSFLTTLSKILNSKSNFFTFAVCVALLSIGWCAFVYVANNKSIMFGWDYCSQYITFYYDYWDIWTHFFKTGEFTLIDFSTYLGVDNIGSNSYYGLFDPFVILLTLFPRESIPQAFTGMTVLKIVTSACIMRAYLRYMNIKEGTANFGALAYAFSGYMNFMLGFCTFVSTVIYVPMMMLGLEKIIRERKPGILIWSLFLIGITSFFFLVVLCIWGVMYALWRFFQTIKQRKAKENITVMIMGVCAFIVGLMLCAFTVIPSLRQSTLTGRTSSIGSAYLNALKESFISKEFFELLFEPVGGSPAREIMPLVSFFFPTGGYQYLPMMIPSSSYKYDAWVASIFCYTPFIILFFLALLNSARKKKFSHYIAILVCLYFLFTDLAYFGFFAFTGNGYGRWFLILIPCIIYYGCWAFDDIEDCPKAFPAIAGSLAILATLGTYFLTVYILKGKTFEKVNGYTYFITDEYLTAGDYTASYNGYKYNTVFTLLIQVFFVLVEGCSISMFPKRKKLVPFLTGALAVEIVIMGNMVYVFNGYWSTEKNFNGGSTNLSDSVKIGEYINDYDDLVYRSYFESSKGEKNFANATGTNASSGFHSLMNFEVYDYAIMMKMANTGSSGVSYDQEWYNPSWSSVYTNKRFATDVKQGYKYYVIKNGGYPNFESENVPFNSKLIASYKNYRIYENEDAVDLGYAVDSDKLYYIKAEGDKHNANYFYNNSRGTMMMTEDVMLSGAIFNDDFKLDNFEIKDPENLSVTGVKSWSKNSYNVDYYLTSSKDLFLAGKDSGYRNEGPLYFLNHYTTKTSKTTDFSYIRDIGKVVLTPKNGTYFNEDNNGCYINIDLYKESGSEPRIYMFGDTFDENGNLLKENVQLNYEYGSFYNTKSGGYQVFGMYAKGRVKYICFCAPSGVTLINFKMPNLHIQEYSTIEAKLDRIHQNELTDVVRLGKNKISAKSNYDEDKIVVTHLAYDDSWEITSNYKEIQTFKVDGGFLGFVAPKGDKTYIFEYKTKSLSLGVALFVIGSSAFFIYAGYDFVKTAKRRKQITIEN